MVPSSGKGPGKADLPVRKCYMMLYSVSRNVVKWQDLLQNQSHKIFSCIAIAKVVLHACKSLISCIIFYCNIHTV